MAEGSANCVLQWLKIQSQQIDKNMIKQTNTEVPNVLHLPRVHHFACCPRSLSWRQFNIAQLQNGEGTINNQEHEVVPS